jgi:glycosyltransferase involved in cell wall biosynthesis
MSDPLVSRSRTKSQMTSVYMMDLWCQIPFYDAYLCNALEAEGVPCVLGSTRFHLEPDYFRRRGVRIDSGLANFASGLNIRNPRVRRTLRFLEFCVNIVALAFRFLFSRPDIIHVQWIPLVDEGFPFEWWFLKLAKRLGSKLVYTVHNVLPHDPEKNYRETFSKSYSLMDALVCHTRETRERVIGEFGVDPKKIWVIPHGPLFHDYEHISKEEAKGRIGISPEQCVVLYQGLVRPYKGIDFLLDAWKQIQVSHPNATLVIAGRGEARHMEMVRAKVDELGVQSSVRLDLRYITSEELPVYYQACDIAVYLHREITQSGALMTGIAFGKPIVATALTGFREALEGYNGALCVEYGDVEALVQLLGGLVGDPEKRRLLVNNSANDEAQAFWRTIAQKTRKCYEAVLGNHEASAADATPNLTDLDRSHENLHDYETRTGLINGS